MLSIILPAHEEPDALAFMQEVENRLPAMQIIVSNDREGRGKGWAIREALVHAKGDQIAFIDADGDIKPKMLLRLLPFLEEYDAVVGSKSIGHRCYMRRIVSHLSRIYIRLFFGLSVDTQTGIKLFRREAIREWKTDGFMYDVELLRGIKRRGGKILEVPIRAEIKAKLSWRVLWQTFLESLRLMLL